MPDRTIRLLLWTATLICISMGIAALVGSTTKLAELAGSDTTSTTYFSSQPTTTDSETLSIVEEDFQAHWTKTLQRPIVDPPPAKEKEEAPPPVEEQPKPKPPPTPPPVRLDAILIGTLVDADDMHARAWIESNGRKLVVKRGDVLVGHPGSPSISSIHESHVVVDIAEESRTLRLRETSFVVSRTLGTSEETDDIK